MNKTTTPTGDYIAQRDDAKHAFNHNLFEEVFAADNLRRAWKQVRANKGAAGVDGMKIENFLDWASPHIARRIRFQGKYGKTDWMIVRKSIAIAMV